MSIISVCAVCIVSAVVSSILKHSKPEYSVLISICTGCCALLLVFSQISPILSTAESLFDKSGVSTDYIKTMLKAAGICYISHFGSMICKDSNCVSAAENIELCAKASIAVLTLPILSDIIDTILSLSSVG